METQALRLVFGISGLENCDKYIKLSLKANLIFRFTPNMISNPKVDNPSPARIFGDRTLSFDAGIDYTHQLNKNVGMSAGIDLGIVDWNHHFEAPGNAFGTKQGTSRFSTNSNGENYFY